MALSLVEDFVFGAFGSFAATSAEPWMLVSSLAKESEFAIFQAWSWAMRADGSANRPEGLFCRRLSIALRNSERLSPAR